MVKPETLIRSGASVVLVLVLVGLGIASHALADDRDDVLAVIHEYGDLEDDLEAQSKMMRDDRVWIAGGIRHTSEEKNMSIQMANRKSAEARNGGKTRFITTIEAPTIAIYGDVAVASFMRTFNVYPHNQPPNQGSPAWVTLVLVKENGEWGIAHTHQSPVGGNN